MAESRDRELSFGGAGEPDAAADALGRRVGALLRTPEAPDADFRQRVLAAITAEAASRTPLPIREVRTRPELVAVAARPAVRSSWWRNPRPFALSPLSALAIAAGFAGIVVLVHDYVRPPGHATPPPPVASAPVATDAGETGTLPSGPTVVASGPTSAVPDTVHLVRFVLVAPAESSVALVGDFNGWDRQSIRLVRAEPADAAMPAGIPEGSALWTVTIPLPEGRHEYAFVLDGTEWVADPGAPRVEDEFGTASSIVLLASDPSSTDPRGTEGGSPDAKPAADSARKRSATRSL